MPLLDQHRRFLVLDQGIVPVVINFLINGAVAWFLFRSLETVPLWGFQSIAGDTISTGFIIPLITSVLTAPAIRGQVIAGKLPPLPYSSDSRIALLIDQSPLRRGVFLGLLAMFLLAVPAVLGFMIIGYDELALPSFLWFKAGFAAVLAALMTPLLGWSALAASSTLVTQSRTSELHQ